MAKLVVLKGASRGALIHLLPDVNRLGRDPGAEVPVLDPQVSRSHAEVALVDGGFALRDAGSRNGTYLNGLPCASGETYPLRDGDEIRAGATTLAFFEAEEDEPDVPSGSTAGVPVVSRPQEATAAGVVPGRGDAAGVGEGDRRPLPSRPAAPHPMLVGRSPAILRVAEAIKRAATVTATVLVTGESGTGKELVAEAIHRASPRAGGPFLAINAATLGAELFESELFGHEKGAFTGAVCRKLGLLELGDGGTLFLDEVAELPASSQAKLLRALDRLEFRRVGGAEIHRADVRIVAATHDDLGDRVREGAFREDLYYRLRVVEIAIPPLCERQQDIPLLVEHFLAELGSRIRTPVRGFSKDALALLRRHPFPGNVRELRNIVERVLIFAGTPLVERDDLPLEVRAAAAGPARGAGAPLALATIERAHILRVLDHAGGNKTRAAALLGIDRATLYRKLLQYGEKA